jgi:hypothetical protein
MKKITLFFSLFITIAALKAQNELLVYSVKVQHDHHALIPEDLSWEEVPFMLKRKLNPYYFEKTITQKIDQNYDYTFEEVLSKRTDQEEWMRLPYKVVSDAHAIKTYDQKGQLINDIPLDEEGLQDYQEALELRRLYGFHPGYQQFPFPDTIHSSFATQLGIQMIEHGPDLVEYRYDNGVTEFFNREALSITRISPLSEESQQVREETEFYAQFEDWGYLKVRHVTNLFLDNGIIIRDDERFSDHNLRGNAPGSESLRALTTLELSPNPAQDLVTVEFSDVPLRIKEVEILDPNNQTIMSLPGSQSNNMQLNIGSIPAGVYLLKVQTDNGVFTETIYKI